MGKKSILVVTMVVLFAATLSEAHLYNRGRGLIYDDVLDITWLQDANYAFTSGYDGDGRMTWDQALAWAESLEYAGYDDWRLPTAYNLDGSGPSSGYNVTGSEMGHLFYEELGNTAAIPISNTGPFLNLSTVQGRSEYWSGTEYAPEPSRAWDFYFYYGSQSSNHKLATNYAWAVRDGDVHPIPTHIYNDGGVHTIDFQINEAVVEVYDSSDGNPTTVNLVSGGSVEYGLRVFDNSHSNVSGGYVEADLSAFDNSNVNVSGGILDAGLYGFDNSRVTFSGGSVRDLRAYDNSQIDFAGGTIEADLKAGSDTGSHTAVITIHGRGFNYPLGEITVSSGTLTGTLANGDHIKNDFRIYSNASIVLVSDSGVAYPFCWDYLTQCYGDSDNSGDVKGPDFLALKSSWYKCYSDPDYDPCADFNRDGCVSGADFLALKNNWYKPVPADCTPGDPYGIYQ